MLLTGVTHLKYILKTMDSGYLESHKAQGDFAEGITNIKKKFNPLT